MKKIWAILTVIGFTAFWTFGFIAASGVFGDRDSHPMTFVLCIAGLGAGLYGWFQIMRTAPKMHGKRAAARARMEEEFQHLAG
ncbi:MAG: hypothetical protein KDA50_11215 [Rhodobacteraceae bacterium]|nr:hypothetical protein [Paracoccaceae bacterium]